MIHSRKFIELITTVRAHLLWCFKQDFSYIDFYGIFRWSGSQGTTPLPGGALRRQRAGPFRDEGCTAITKRKAEVHPL